ncbi:MAG: hypothetical protein ACYC0F_00445 [Rhodanobacter sp.]
MNPNDVIEAYVVDVVRRVPTGERNDIGLELRDLLGEMLADRSQAAGRPADDAMVLAMLRDFGTPAEVAARYKPPGMVIIPAEQTRSFALSSVIGVVLQWALTLPRVFAGQPLAAWWLSWGLGALWWPGLLVMIALLAAWLRHMGWFQPAWKPRTVDPDRVNRGAMAAGLAGGVIGAAFMTCLPWLAGLMPDPLARVFAFDPGFLRQRAWPVLPLWLGVFAIQAAVLSGGRWSSLTRRLDIAFSVGFIALLAWWLAAGDIFQARLTDDGAKGALGLVVLIIVVDLACKLYRQRTRIRFPQVAG